MLSEIRRDYDLNNDNIRAGAKFDPGGGAETSFPLTVALTTGCNK